MGEAALLSEKGTPLLIDTNIFIDHLRGHAPATRFLTAIDGRRNVYFSAITETELLAGAENNVPSKKEAAAHLIHRWEKVVVNNPVAAFAGDLRRLHAIATPDAIIAASAMVHHAVLVTKNLKDFKRVPGLQVAAPY
jgi:hypothetical protein